MKVENLLTKDQNNNQPTVASSDDGTVTFAALLDMYVPEPLRQGQMIEGQILRIDDNIIFADVGAKRTAIIPPNDLEQVETKILDSLSVGDEVLLYVLRTPRGDEDLLVSLQRGLQQQDWRRAQESMDVDEMLQLKVVSHNKGGILVEFGHLQGFVPNSHHPEIFRQRDARQQASLKSQLVGETLPVKIIEIDRERKRLVMSMKEAQKELRQQRLQELKPGEKITGTVISLVNFGAFVDVGGVDGLIHISNLSWRQVQNPAEVISVGDEVQVLIEDVDISRERVSLSRKACLPNPWQTFAQNHILGELLEGVVTNVTDFGAFVLLAADLEGLVHISEMRVPEGSHPRDVLKTGDVVLVRLVDVEPEDGRIRLSQRRVTAVEEVEWMARRSEPQLAAA